MSDRRKVLIISTTFFPDPMVGSVRMTQWCRYLPDLGWKPTVICRHYGYDITPAMLAAHVHPDVDVHYLGPRMPKPDTGTAPAKGRQNVLSRMVNSIGDWVVPDRSARFWVTMTGAVDYIARQTAPDVILTTSPTASTHIPGQVIAKRYGLPWVADFRDPHYFDPRFQPRGLARIMLPSYRKFEERIYDEASLITHAVPFHARWAQRAFPRNRDKIRVVMNGYPEDLIDGTIHPDPPPPGRKSVRIVGAIAPQDLQTLADAVKIVNTRGIPTNLRIVGAKPSNEPEVRKQLGEGFVVTGYLKHPQAMSQILGADVLISFLSAERARTYQLTSKLFEFAAAEKPIIEINPSVPDRLLMHRLPGVTTLHLPTAQQIADAIYDALTKPTVSISKTDPEFFRTLSRRYQAEQLAEMLDEIVD